MQQKTFHLSTSGGGNCKIIFTDDRTQPPVLPNREEPTPRNLEFNRSASELPVSSPIVASSSRNNVVHFSGGSPNPTSPETSLGWKLKNRRRNRSEDNQNANRLALFSSCDQRSGSFLTSGDENEHQNKPRSSLSLSLQKLSTLQKRNAQNSAQKIHFSPSNEVKALLLNSPLKPKSPTFNSKFNFFATEKHTKSRISGINSESNEKTSEKNEDDDFTERSIKSKSRESKSDEALLCEMIPRPKEIKSLRLVRKSHTSMSSMFRNGSNVSIGKTEKACNYFENPKTEIKPKSYLLDFKIEPTSFVRVQKQANRPTANLRKFVHPSTIEEEEIGQCLMSNLKNSVVINENILLTLKGKNGTDMSRMSSLKRFGSLDLGNNKLQNLEKRLIRKSKSCCRINC